jgi:hypothetical protein
MKTISGTARGLVRRAGLMASAAAAVTAMSHGRAEALSLASPATLPSAKHASEAMTIEVRGGHHGGGFRGGGGGGFRGGGGGGFRGFHGGGGYRGFHGGGFRAAHVYRGGGFRAAPIYRGGGYHRFGGYGVHRYAYHRPYFRRHFHHRRYFAPAYYGYYPRYYRPYRVCRVVWTYWGPRRICRPPYWHRHHYWRVRYW